MVCGWLYADIYMVLLYSSYNNTNYAREIPHLDSYTSHVLSSDNMGQITLSLLIFLVHPDPQGNIYTICV